MARPPPFYGNPYNRFSISRLNDPTIAIAIYLQIHRALGLDSNVILVICSALLSYVGRAKKKTRMDVSLNFSYGAAKLCTIN